MTGILGAKNWEGTPQYKRNADDSRQCDDTFYFLISGVCLTQIPFLYPVRYELNCVPPKFVC